MRKCGIGGAETIIESVPIFPLGKGWNTGVEGVCWEEVASKENFKPLVDYGHASKIIRGVRGGVWGKGGRYSFTFPEVRIARGESTVGEIK